MAMVLTFRYDCGFEVDIPMVPGQGKIALVRTTGPTVSRRHKKNCKVCQERRRERFQRGRETTRRLGQEPSSNYSTFTTAQDRTP